MNTNEQIEAYKQVIDIVTLPSLDITIVEKELAKEHPDIFLKLFRAAHPDTILLNKPEWYTRSKAFFDEKNKISAIKEVRTWTGWGLKESKDYIDAGMPFPVPSNFPRIREQP